MMIRSISRLSVVLLALCLITVSAWSADIAVKFRKDALAKFGISAADPGQRALTFSYFYPPNVSRSDAFTDPRTMAVVGGVMFTATATPMLSELARCPDLKIETTAPNGTHLTAKFGAQIVKGRIYDWEMLPLVQFVKDGEAALYTYMSKVGQAQYHRAFQNNLVGLNLFLLDNASEIEDFPRAHLLIENEIPGYPQSEPTPESLAAWETIKPSLSFNARVRQMMFVDKDVDFKFQPVGSDLEISGTPYWLLLSKRADGSGQVVGELKETDLVRKTNPVIYESIYRISRFAAFFRYIKESCPTNWNAFLAEVDSKKGALANVVIPEGMPIRIRSTRTR